MSQTFEIVRRKLEAFSSETGRLRGGYTGGGSGEPPMEARIARLEATTEHIQSDLSDLKGDVRALRGDQKTDFRILFGALIAVALGLAGLMAKGFGWL